ncbi:MAG TPA: isochorismatase family cysteine hydrolase [Jatrophihabitans sp.]
MIKIDGKQVLTSLQELVDPARAALILVDMQKDFIDPDGEFARLGLDLSMYPAMRGQLAGLLAAARDAGVLIVHIQMTTLHNRLSDSPAQIRFNMRMHESARADGPPLRYTEPGTPGHDFVEECTPRAGEPVVQKWRSSGFWGTNLDMLLRSNRIETVVMTGCTTEGCVESTARDAMFNDYYVVIAEDCVASDDPQQHAASLLLMRHRFDIAPAEQITAAWATATRTDVVSSHPVRTPAAEQHQVR